MIILNHTNRQWEWGLDMHEGWCSHDAQIYHAPATRQSALLGPDGEPLQIGYERPRLGFDLRPKSLREITA